MLIPTAIEQTTTGFYNAYAYLRDEKTAGTTGGAATAASFQTRTLNTEVVDTAGFVSLSSNQFTLAAASYYIQASAPFYAVGRVTLKIRNVTDGSDALIGGSAYCVSSTDGAIVRPQVRGIFTIVATKAFELQYQCDAVFGGDTKCLGVDGSHGVTEVYGEVEIWRRS